MYDILTELRGIFHYSFLMYEVNGKKTHKYVTFKTASTTNLWFELTNLIEACC